MITLRNLTKVADTRQRPRTVLDSVNLRIAKEEDVGIMGLISGAELPTHGQVDQKMVALDNITKVYDTRQGPRTVLDGVNFRIAAGEKVGIIGRNGAGKSTLMRLISGAELPTQGRIDRKMSVSWPLAFGGGFQGSLTGLDNLRFICRVYGVSYEDAVPFVEEFSDLGSYLREPVKKYSSGMRARLAFALSMAVEFDCFLIDEIIAVGDSRFHAKCHEELFEKRKDRAMILVSHSPGHIRNHCDHAGVIIAGKLQMFDQVDEALAFYQEYSR
jgi:capsular polysaccharide transport system ATP-binding protein